MCFLPVTLKMRRVHWRSPAKRLLVPPVYSGTATSMLELHLMVTVWLRLRKKKMYLVRLRNRLWLDLNKEVTYTHTYVTYVT